MNKLRIYVFGNTFVKEDIGALLIMPVLQRKFPEIQFILTDPNEDFPPKKEKDIIILDTVKGISSTTLLDFTNLQNIEKTPISPHDYDLLLHLLLLKKMGKINSVKIIGLPMYLVIKKELNKTIQIISSLL
ncbi:hypothetical protein COY87_03185 [Candidatus Roizmanbacteria bacterium CG_4_10_14_0_8_um_filter_33_9]|uniref:Uncharacterized protein n=1 Tax=Candidatus Roizmanbacteria bacterium CG_4_10_14_0_8_um_filter_33_9 TaxID=1974826 RepID=A0A2M7QI80_9BACT|nr:MAG: hypothetical protein COY87_03185 [Candidatus Roizmanbacteria bacterium CG_4_10_14_0_8_um_filter_33_9]